MKSLALTIRFILELAMLTGIVLGWTGAVDGAGGWIGGIATAFLAAALWTFFIAPKATRRLDTAPRVALEFVLFALAAGLLIAGGLGGFGIALFAVWVVDTVCIVAFGITERDFMVKPPE